MNTAPELIAAVGPRVRTSPFFDRTVAAGLVSVSTYNHMWLPMSYGDTEAEYERLVNGVSMWDVAAQRHLRVTGRGADDLVRVATVVDTSSIDVGSAAYAPMVDVRGDLVNDPILLHIAVSHWRFSIADSDIRLWLEALAEMNDLEAEVDELDTATLAIQGPRADDVVSRLGLADALELETRQFRAMSIKDIDVIISRSGWSHQGGFELFLDDPTRAEELWDAVARAGEPVGIGPGAPHPWERIENTLLSYGTDTGYHANPFEVGLGDLVDFTSGDFVGRAALEAISRTPPSRRLEGVRLDGEQMETLARPLPVRAHGKQVGQLRAAAWSPKFSSNLGLVLLDSNIGRGQRIEVVAHPVVSHGEVVDLPFAS